MCTWISQWFLAKNLFLLFKNNFKRNNHCKFIHYKSYIKQFLSYLPCIVHREYFSIIFSVKKCKLYSIKHGSKIWWNYFFIEKNQRKSLANFLLSIVNSSNVTFYEFGIYAKMTSFKGQAGKARMKTPRVLYYETFYGCKLQFFYNKLECLSLASLSSLV